MPAPFLSSADVHATDNPKHFSCGMSVIGLPPGHFPGMMETDLGNGDPFYLDHAIYDGGYFVGVAYRQSGGCRVSAFIDRGPPVPSDRRASG